jgi:phasin
MASQAGPNFQIPPEMRSFAEQSVEQARKAFETVMDAAQSAVSSFEGQAAAAQAGAKDVQRKAFTFAEHNVDASFEFAQKLLSAKTGEEVVKMHADYVKSQMQTLTDQTRELGQTATKPAGNAKD